MATDPVCGVKVDQINSEFQAQYAGKKYYFCSEECKKLFENHPNEYAKPAAA